MSIPKELFFNLIAMSKLRFFTFFAAFAFLSSSAHAVYTVYVVQSGSNVVATGSGSINTSALTLSGSLGCGNGEGYIWASDAFLCAPGALTEPYFSGVSGTTSFGTGTLFAGDSRTGNGASIWGQKGWVSVPDGYISGSTLSGTVIWNGTTLSALGLTPGTYSWSWGSGANADSYVVKIGISPPTPAAIPTLSEWAMIFMASLMAMFGIRRMRRSK